MSKEKKKKSENKSRRFVISIPFEVEIEGRGPYTVCEEVDLFDLDIRCLVEDRDDPIKQSES